MKKKKPKRKAARRNCSETPKSSTPFKRGLTPIPDLNVRHAMVCIPSRGVIW